MQAEASCTELPSQEQPSDWIKSRTWTCCLASHIRSLSGGMMSGNAAVTWLDALRVNTRNKLTAASFVCHSFLLSIASHSSGNRTGSACGLTAAPIAPAASSAACLTSATWTRHSTARFRHQRASTIFSRTHTNPHRIYGVRPFGTMLTNSLVSCAAMEPQHARTFHPTPPMPGCAYSPSQTVLLGQARCMIPGPTRPPVSTNTQTTS